MSTGAEPVPPEQKWFRCQDTTPWAHLQAAPQPQAESPALGLLHERKLGAPAAQLYGDASGCQAALLSAQARVAELESQVRELERGQHKLLLESLQQRHREDLDRLESAHRSLVKVVEESCRQREERLQQEKEQLTAQLLSQRWDVEQARAELLAQLQQCLTVLAQQRVSVPEIHKDHKEQLQHLRDQETDAATSATLSTRSLNSVMEQIEKRSSDPHNLLQKMEAIHHTTQQPAMEAQRRDKQLEVLQERLLQQQRDMEEERSRAQEVMAKMEARLGEQTLLLEQERQRATAEQSKVESLQRLLEEQQRVMTQKRAELERAKSSFLEEQKAARQKLLEEEQKLAAEQALLRTWQQLSKERMGRDVDRALQRDSQREDTIMSLAKEQAELKIRGHELKAKEEQLVRDREVLEEAWQDLRLEKAKVNWAALRVRQREKEIKSPTKERLSVAHQRRWLKQQHEELPINPTTLLTMDQDLSAPTTGLSSTLGLWSPIRALPSHTPGDSRESLAMAGSAGLSTTLLLLLQHRAQQDYEYLARESLFLESLKKVPYHASPRPR